MKENKFLFKPHSLWYLFLIAAQINKYKKQSNCFYLKDGKYDFHIILWELTMQFIK